MPNRKITSALFIVLTAFLLSTGMIGCQKDGDKAKGGANGGILSYVPADTIFFAGGLEPMPLQDTLKMMGDTTGMYAKVISDSIEKSSNPPTSPAGKMIVSLITGYVGLLDKQQEFSQKTGIDANTRIVLYSVGTIPVLRMQLKDKAAFDKYIDAAEQKAGITSEKASLGSVSVRHYSFSDKANDKANDKENNAKMAIAVQGNYGIFTLTFDKLGEETNRQIVGDILPTTALSKDSLNALVSKYRFDPRSLFYIDHKQIMRGLTHSDNQFGNMLMTFVNMAKAEKTEVMSNAMDKEPAQADAPSEGQPESETPPKAAENEAKAEPENPFKEMQTPECQKELTSKVETWPRTVGGYTSLDFNSKPIKMDFLSVVEINDPKFTQSLTSLRGVLPQFLTSTKTSMILGLGLGINVDSIAPFVTQFVKDFTEQDYKCKFLADMKTKMQASNPALAVGMMTGMMSGVYGVSASLLSFEGNFDPSMQAPPDIKNLQALVTVSAKNPQMLLMMMSNMQPGMPPINLPADGTPIDFPIPFPTPEPIKLALKGNHLVAFLGKDASAIASSLQKQPLDGNGLLAINLDYRKYMDILMSTVKSMPPDKANDPEIQDMIKFFENFKYHVIEGMDVSNNGIEFTATITAE